MIETALESTEALDQPRLAAHGGNVGRELMARLRAVLEALPDTPQRPGVLARRLRLNRDICGRVLMVCREREPLQALHVAPGPEPLRRFVRAAAREEVPRDAIAAAMESIDRFDQLIRNEAGTRAVLNACLSASLPTARERFELASKQAVFKGMGQLRGVEAAAWLSCQIFHPSSGDPLRHDAVVIDGAVGIRRLRPNVPLKVRYDEFPPFPGLPVAAALESASVAVPLDWRPFAANPPAQLRSYGEPPSRYFVLDAHDAGPQAMVDLFGAWYHARGRARSIVAENGYRRCILVLPDIPAQTLVFDAVLHEDVYPGAEPELSVFRVHSDGPAHPDDPRRQGDRIAVAEHIEFLGRDLRRLHVQEWPGYADYLVQLIAALGWNPAAFRAYRCRIQYPVPDWQVAMAFQPPAGYVPVAGGA